MIYIMCDETSCIHNRVHNGKFNRCFNDNITIINSNNCNFKNKEVPIEDLDLTSELIVLICDYLIKKEKCQGGNCDNCINKQAEEILKL